MLLQFYPCLMLRSAHSVFEAVGILGALEVHCRGCPQQEDCKITRNKLVKGNETQFSHP
jgi:hypothetical protein